MISYFRKFPHNYQQSICVEIKPQIFEAISFFYSLGHFEKFNIKDLKKQVAYIGGNKIWSTKSAWVRVSEGKINLENYEKGCVGYIFYQTYNVLFNW